MSDIEIRLCKTWNECVQCEELQKRVWEMPDYRDVVPANLLSTAIKNGGLLVGAFDGATMVGFAFGFLGSEMPHGLHSLKHTSHMLAVLPGARTRGLGARLKWYQRAQALNQGLDRMTWTYDPLQAINAQLNLVRLGVIARRYYRDVYGAMTDALNVGVASDRFEVEWFLTNPRVTAREHTPPLAGDYPGSTLLFATTRDADGLVRITGQSEPVTKTMLVEIPADFNRMKTVNRELAVEWRARTRAAFERMFALGYVVHDVVRRTDETGEVRFFYVLSRNSEIHNRPVFDTCLCPAYNLSTYAPNDTGKERGGFYYDASYC